MALNKIVLKNQLLSLQQEMKTRENDSMEYYATQLATIIDEYIKSAHVSTVVTGECLIPPSTTGTISGNGAGSLS